MLLSLGHNIDNRTERVQVKSFKPLPGNYTLITARIQRILYVHVYSKYQGSFDHRWRVVKDLL